MMEPKFTKGPWGVSDCRTKETNYPPHKGQEWAMEMLEIAAFKKDSDKLVCVARIDHRVNRLSIDEEDIANANLIAAAPDMYEALEAYEKAEADIVLNANWDTETGIPQITQEQFDRLVECQTLKARALRKARGEK